MERKRITPRTKKGMKTRKDIYETSIALFTKKGYDNVTVEDICQKVGVSKGAFYHHFGSKDQVLREKFMDIDDFDSKAMEDVLNIDDIFEKAYAHTRAVMTFISDLGLDWTKLVFHAEIGPDTKKSYLADLGRPIYENNMSLIREGQERGLIRNDKTSEEMALFIVHCYRGLIYDWCLSNGTFDLVEASKEMIDLLIEGMRT